MSGTTGGYVIGVSWIDEDRTRHKPFLLELLNEEGVRVEERVVRSGRILPLDV